jgi:hypothetical protein
VAAVDVGEPAPAPSLPELDRGTIELADLDVVPAVTGRP